MIYGTIEATLKIGSVVDQLTADIGGAERRKRHMTDGMGTDCRQRFRSNRLEFILIEKISVTEPAKRYSVFWKRLAELRNLIVVFVGPLSRHRQCRAFAGQVGAGDRYAEAGNINFVIGSDQFS